MKLSVKAMAITCAILWGFAMLLMSSFNAIEPTYAIEFLDVIASVYPGYEAGEGIKSIVIGTLYAIVDAGVGGAVFAWVYNFFVT